MSANANTFEILVKVSNDLRALRESQEQFLKFKEKMGEVAGMFKLGGAFAAAGLTLEAVRDRIRETITESTILARELNTVKSRLNVSPESFQVLTGAVKASNGEVDQLQMGITSLTRKLAEAKAGSKDALAPFRTLELDPRKLELEPVTKQLEDIGQAFVRAHDQNAAFNSTLR